MRLLKGVEVGALEKCLRAKTFVKKETNEKIVKIETFCMSITLRSLKKLSVNAKLKIDPVHSYFRLGAYELC